MEKIYDWVRILTKFASIQLLVQAIGLASGIFLVRTLEKNEYAYFTLANTMQATMALLADVGISSGISATGGKVWNDRFRFGQLINTALKLRRSLLLIAMFIVAPVLIWMLRANGSTIVYASLLTAVVLIGLNFQVTNGVLIMIPRLHLQIDRIQKLDLILAISRLFLFTGIYFIVVNAATAVLVAVVTFLIQYLVLKGWSTRTIDTKAPINENDRRSLWTIVRRQAPNDIYFCFQGQLTIFLIGLFGSTKNIAEIGALGRLAVIFSIVTATMTSVILPRFSRCQVAKVMKTRYLQIVGMVSAFGLIIFLLAAFFPTQFLYILGPKYMHLKAEVGLMVLSSVVGGINGVMWGCNYSKGWIPNAWIAIPAGIGSQIILLFLFDISTIQGVLSINIFSLLVGLVVNMWVAYRELRQLQSSI